MATRARTNRPTPARAPALPKAPSGIAGLDELTEGGLPRGRPTLVCGAAGCGKTLLAAEFIVRGATEFGEPGVILSFEESADELGDNMRSLGFDLEQLQARGLIALDHVHIERSEIEETGEFDLEGLFIRLGHAVDTVGARRVAVDGVEALLAGMPNEAVVRSELRRLFRWFKQKGLTAVITAERGANSLTRHGLEEYVADCVILLDHRVDDQISTRRLRVVKYRGSAHGTNEYPFMIGRSGLSVLPVTSMTLDHPASDERVSTGIGGLDEMLGGVGVYRGSSLMVSGAPGTGKSSIAASFADAACRRGERAVMFAYEESKNQLLRNMRSIGVDLEQWERKGLLAIHSSRPTLHGLEQHLVAIYSIVRDFQPSVVVVDPISNLASGNLDPSLRPTLMRLIDFLKRQQVTALFTALTSDAQAALADSSVGVSSLMDTWLLLANVAYNAERTRTLQVLKSRGMPHSNQVREFVFSDHGVDLVDVYLAGQQVLTGTARVAEEAQALASADLRARDHERRLRHLASRRKAIDAQIAALNADADERADQVQFEISREQFEAEGVLSRARSVAHVRAAQAGGAVSGPAATTGAPDKPPSTRKRRSQR